LKLSPTLRYAAAFVLPLAAVGAALYTQFRMDMQPCPWCVLQRLIYIAIAVAALPGLLLNARPVRLLSALLMLVLAGCGIAAALWQHFVASKSESCGLTFAHKVINEFNLAEQFPAFFEATADCSKASGPLFGVPYPVVSLALFVLLAVIAATLIAAPKRRR